MGVHRDLRNLTVRCLVCALHLQRGRSRLGLQAIGEGGGDQHRGDLLVHLDDAHAEQVLDQREDRTGVALQEPADRGEGAGVAARRLM